MPGAWARGGGRQQGRRLPAELGLKRAFTRLPSANLAPSSLVTKTVTRSLSLAWEPRATWEEGRCRE